MVNLPGAAPRNMDFLARFFYRYRRISKALRLFLIIAGPGIIVMVADNDAGGITTYSVTGSNENGQILGVVPYRDMMNLKHLFLE